MSKKQEPVLISARVSPQTKKRLEDYCAGNIDGMKHIQENVVDVAIKKFIDHTEKLEKMTKL